MKLVVQSCAARSSQHVLDDFATAILRDPGVRLAPRLPVIDKVSRAYGRVADARPRRHILRGAGATRGDGCLVLMMGPAGHPYLPQFLLRRHRSLYLFDAWPATYPGIVHMTRRWGVDDLFVSASQAADALRLAIDSCRVTWVPEGIEPATYRSRLPEQRDIDILQFGRKHPGYHDAITAPLAAAGRSYVYEQSGGPLVYPTPESFVEGLSRTKVSICFPCSLTHPERSGDTQTMTQRYLQSMASRCLVVGSTPDEMRGLFGYEAVIEADFGDPAGQLLEILDTYDRYLPLIERNYRTVVEDHSWSRRWEVISSTLASRR